MHIETIWIVLAAILVIAEIWAINKVRKAEGKSSNTADSVRIAMQQNEPYIVAIYQAHNDLDATLKPWKRRKPICTEIASYCEADRISHKTASPDHHNESAKAKSPCTGGITGKQS